MALDTPVGRCIGGRILEIVVTGTVTGYQDTYRLEIGTDDGVLTRRVPCPEARSPLPAVALWENVEASSVTPRVRVVDSADDSEIVGWASGSSVSITGTAAPIYPTDRPLSVRADLPRLCFSYRIARLGFSTNTLANQAAVDALLQSGGMVTEDRGYITAEDWLVAKVDPIQEAHPGIGLLAFDPFGALGYQPSASLIAAARNAAIGYYENGTLYASGYAAMIGVRAGTTWDGWVTGDDALVPAFRRRVEAGRPIASYMAPPTLDLQLREDSPTLSGLIYSGSLGIFDTMGGNIPYAGEVEETRQILVANGLPVLGEAGGFRDENLERLPAGAQTLASVVSVFDSGGVTLPIPSNAIVWFRDETAVAQAVADAQANFVGTPAEDWADAVDALSDTGELLVAKAAQLMMRTPGLASTGTTYVIELRSYDPSTDTELREVLNEMTSELGVSSNWFSNAPGLGRLRARWRFH